MNSKVEYSSPGGIQRYWLTMDHRDVPMKGTSTAGTGSISLADGDHVLVWWALGAPGSSFTINVQLADPVKPLKVDDSIPQSYSSAAGFKRFKV